MKNNKEIYTVIEYCNGKPNCYLGTFDNIKTALDETLKDAIQFIKEHNKGVDENEKYYLYDVMSYDFGETYPDVEYLGLPDSLGEDGIMFRIDYKFPQLNNIEVYEYRFFSGFLNKLTTETVCL